MKDKKNDNERLTELTPEMMQAYHNGTLRPAQQRAVELYLLDNPFEAEAMEGFTHVTDFDRTELVSKMSERLDRGKGSKVIPLWNNALKIAAAVLVLVVSMILIVNTFDWFEEDNPSLALNESSEDNSDTIEVVEEEAKLDQEEVDETEELEPITMVLEEEVAEPVEQPPKLSEPISDEPKPVLEEDVFAEAIAMADEEIEEQEMDAIRQERVATSMSSAKKMSSASKETINQVSDESGLAIVEDEVTREQSSNKAAKRKTISTTKLKDQKATPINGFEAFEQYLVDSLRYPEEALAQRVEGGVSVDFTINELGELTDFVIVKGVGYGCDEEAIRLIKEGVKWLPAIKDGAPTGQEQRVKVRFKLP